MDEGMSESVVGDFFIFIWSGQTDAVAYEVPLKDFPPGLRTCEELEEKGLIKLFHKMTEHPYCIMSEGNSGLNANEAAFFQKLLTGYYFGDGYDLMEFSDKTGLPDLNKFEGLCVDSRLASYGFCRRSKLLIGIIRFTLDC